MLEIGLCIVGLLFIPRPALEVPQLQLVATVSEQNAASAQEIASSAEEQSAAAEEMASSAEELSRTADELRSLVNQFKIK